MDGCTAATYIAYAFSEVATIYPITPIAEMGEIADKWAVAGLNNLLGYTLEIKEMESELGAAGATHGALCGGSLATTFTSSQGLMLMIPNMYKIAGEMLPAVFHVGCRSLATHALSIFGDHQDVMATRATGFCMLASSSVQTTHDLAIVAHIAALEGSLPVLHFFDGWRTSNQTATIETLSFDELQPLLPMDDISKFRARSMNPEHPDLRGSAQNWDVYFQNTEARNSYYDRFPSIVQNAMDKVGDLTGRRYHLFDYYGAPDATDIIVSIGSSAEVVRYTIEHLNKNGNKYGVVNVRLYRPFDTDAFVASLPPTVKRIAVLDRTKEAGGQGEPLYLDVVNAIFKSGKDIMVVGGRYGLSSKEFDPTMVKAVYDNLSSDNPINGFTVGINDDVTHKSLSLNDPLIFNHPDIKSAVFYGMGSDGTVGATKVAAHILEEVKGYFSQAYFEYSAKKSGGFTISQLRFGKNPITLDFGIEQADYVACNKCTYVNKYGLADKITNGGIFVLNSPWNIDDIEKNIPSSLKRDIASKRLRFYNIDALSIANAHNLGVRINMIMLATFFLLQSENIEYEDALAALKQYITNLYIHEGGEVVKNNIAALDAVKDSLVEVNYPDSWADIIDKAVDEDEDVPLFVKNIAEKCNTLHGDAIPVSAFTPDGTMPMGTTAYEKRTIADSIPTWNPEKCIQCTHCSLVCAHAAIRPFLLNDEEKQSAPSDFTTVPAHAPMLKGLNYRIQVYPQDCTGCGSCATICPGKALSMNPISPQLSLQKKMLDYTQKHVTLKPGIIKRETVAGSQFYQPLLEFSGACAGCGETPYVKLLTQLMGERLIIANATGCSSIWGANFPSNAYCVNSDGKGPAWGNSLFEDNAEYGYGIATAIAHRREYLAKVVTDIIKDTSVPAEVTSELQNWISCRGDAIKSADSAKKLKLLIQKHKDFKGHDTLDEMKNLFAKKSVWAIGGDGWAYDIGFAGLDHVLAQNIDINILVMDTECYSNTGGQMSKATPLSATAKYASNGKRTYKKDLGRMMLSYPEVYVASVSLGGNYQQTINALVEADAHPGPSIVIAYCPCINHGIRTGMSHSVVEQKNAVTSGYWPLFSRDPAKSEAPVVESAAPDGTLLTFINGEDRYADLKMADPAETAALQNRLGSHIDAVYSLMMYNSKYISQ